MLFGDHLVIVRGGGDLGTGVVYRLHRAGFPVVVLELAEPLTIRRTVAVSSAVADASITVEGMIARRVDSVADARALARTGEVAVLVSPALPPGADPAAVVDARLAKRNLDTTLEDAAFVVGLGPGFTAGTNCHAVVETARGHRLGRVLHHGSAAPNTGRPGSLGGATAERVVRAPGDGVVQWDVAIGDLVEPGRQLGHIAGEPIVSGIGGVVRGLIAEGMTVPAGLKIADIDPRGDPSACFEISDKALAVGGGVLEAVLGHRNEQP
ncbi:MAG: EF2563 family selenium-dependent molybdenum hydroxylase system protein [Acidimicrobiia bacterium]|nr:EF2563 family selenium-dependent molybdenum hydroxylase system protein [Acidimicrobiia bacterium]NNF09168.1 EF2563 family selenium-dependent molybdenum hydroxylase system protein [Acidimicrobiia bacterium]NNL70050.1 EF2563 family selenium-dependent molybdenum hydroxylase system protein [Acidimicrobiia bacterium]